MKVRLILLLLGFAFPLSSVGAYKAYPGPKLPEDQIATVRVGTAVDFFLSKGLPKIVAVNGNTVPKRNVVVALKPGKHTLEVIGFACGLQFCRVIDLATLTFEAQASHQYFVHQKDGASRIEDWQTKAVVARTRSITLHAAADQGDLDQVKRLILWGAKLKEKDQDGNTPLHNAAIKGRTKVVALLIHEGAKVNAGNNNGDTPLHMAAYYGQTAMVELLIAKGAKVNRSNNDVRRPLSLAIRQGHKDTVALL